MIDVLRIFAIALCFAAMFACCAAILIRENKPIRFHYLLITVLILFGGGIGELIERLGEPFVWYGSLRYVLAATFGLIYAWMSLDDYKNGLATNRKESMS